MLKAAHRTTPPSSISRVRAGSHSIWLLAILRISKLERFASFQVAAVPKSIGAIYMNSWLISIFAASRVLARSWSWWRPASPANYVDRWLIRLESSMRRLFTPYDLCSIMNDVFILRAIWSADWWTNCLAQLGRYYRRSWVCWTKPIVSALVPRLNDEAIASFRPFGRSNHIY